MSSDEHQSFELNTSADSRYDIAGGSDIGRVRTQNQDHYLIGDLRRHLVVRDTDVGQQGDELFGCHEGSLLVVADGMGGHSDGETASRIAVEASAKYVLNMMHWFLKLSPSEENDFVEELSESLANIQEQIRSVDQDMGTTVTMAHLLWPKMYVIHAGDSRCYMFREGELRQLTTDHTIAQQMIDQGNMKPSDPFLKRWQHVLWNCVGGGDSSVRPEALRCKLQPDDVIMLCSDGINGMVDDETIQSVLSTDDGLQAKVDRLIELANEAGGKDNSTVILCHVVSDDDECPEDDATTQIENIQDVD